MEKVVWKQSDFNKMLERIEAAEKPPTSLIKKVKNSMN